ncbi:MAG TPA: hypothetical protein VLA78_10435 [Paracoccaceae bacterium]|nr:hypothetical protein [Paracoccaceae bacterium]
MATRLGRLAVALTLAAAPVQAQEPLSAIDWLSQSIATPAAQPLPPEPDVTTGALPSDVTVSVLGGPSPDAAGVLSSQVTGLPRDLWGLGRTDEIAALIRAERTDALPALKDLLLRVLLAEADAPPDAGGRGLLLLARLDKLLEMGALEQAAALIDAAASEDAQVFRRAFDVAILTGTEDRACDRLRDAPDLAPTFPARIFCLARSGDWNAAALSLRTGQALGQISEAEDALLSRFLDPELYEGDPPLTPPQPVTPLFWRMLDAVGEGLPTLGLPLAFSHAELRDTAGWKAQIEAAERLSRAGVVTPNLLLGIYTARLPAASGGVWDRVDAFQRFDTALASGDVAQVAARLPVVWSRLSAAELEVPFAALYGERLAALDLPPEAAVLAFRVALLSPAYERAAIARVPATPEEAFLSGLARGDLAGTTPPDSLARAIAPAFGDTPPAADLMALVEERRVGEAILMAVDRIARGVQGDMRGVTDGLALLRRLGLEDVARRTALQLMLLERRG